MKHNFNVFYVESLTLLNAEQIEVYKSSKRSLLSFFFNCTFSSSQIVIDSWKLRFKTNRLFKNRGTIPFFISMSFSCPLFLSVLTRTPFYSVQFGKFAPSRLVAISRTLLTSSRDLYAYALQRTSSLTPRKAKVILNDVIVCPSVLFPQQHRSAPTSRIFTDDSFGCVSCLRLFYLFILFFFLKRPLRSFIDSYEYNLWVRIRSKKGNRSGWRGRQLIIRREGGMRKENNVCPVWSSAISQRIISHN